MLRLSLDCSDFTQNFHFESARNTPLARTIRNSKQSEWIPFRLLGLHSDSIQIPSIPSVPFGLIGGVQSTANGPTQTKVHYTSPSGRHSTYYTLPDTYHLEHRLICQAQQLQLKWGRALRTHCVSGCGSDCNFSLQWLHVCPLQKGNIIITA
jgi:hypothetical protein